MTITSTTLSRVQAILAETLGLPDGVSALEPDTPLYGALPELDSLAVLDLLAGLESEFGFMIDDHEFGSDLFASVGSLVAFVDQKLADAA